MKLCEITKKLEFEVKAGDQSLSNEVRGGYASDLISDVIANAQEGDLWVTLQTHQNMVAVASMKGLAGIVLVNGRQPEPDTLRKAREEALREMAHEAEARGADAVVGMDLDYEVLGAQNGMLMVTSCGTAVRLS